MNDSLSAPASVVRPTKKQKELLTFIENFINEHGYSPSYREIMNGLSYTSVATVALHVNNLISRGHIRKRDHSARSLEVVKPSETLKLATNEVPAAQEKWLVEKVEYFIHNAEASNPLERSRLDGLFVLIEALKVLGLEAVAQSFMPRLNALKKRQRA